jgi:two-component system response regulator FlrC
MVNRFRLAGILSDLDAEVRGVAPVDGFGLAVDEGNGVVSFLSRRPWGSSGYTFRIGELPAPFAAVQAGPAQYRPLSAGCDLSAVDGMFARDGLERLIIVPLRAANARLGIVSTSTEGLTREQLDAHGEVGRRVERRIAAADTVEQRLARLDRLDGLDALLPALAEALDVRDIFERLASIAGRVLPHDALELLLPIGDRQRARFHSRAGSQPASLPEVVELPPNAIPTDAWRYFMIDDLQAHPEEAQTSAAAAGFRSSLRVPVRLGERSAAGLNLMSRDKRRYSADDLFVAWKLADHLALALSRTELAEERRRGSALRAQAANLELLDGLLGTLTEVLDIRGVFDRVSAIARKVLPHEAMTVTVVLHNPLRLRVHAISGFGDDFPDSFEMPLPEPALVTEPWDFRIIDLPDDPRYARSPTVAAGMASVLGLPIRVDGRLSAGVNFYSRSKGHFSKEQLLVGRRIADHIALALSHQRLADEIHDAASLRSRAVNLELLDDLLAALPDTGELNEVFERMSAIAKRVLKHDAMALPVLLPDGVHARVYASSGATFPEMVEMPVAFVNRAPWEHDIVDDMRAQPDQRNLAAAKRGYRSALRVPIRLDGALAAGLAFLSFEPSVYVLADVLVARRIADRLALYLSRQKRAEAFQRADEASERAARLESRVRELTDELDSRTGYRRVVGNSPQWRQVLTQATQVAPNDTTVLLLGDSGSGKEVVARFVHRASARANGPFIALNCAALTEQLLEAELFGYERGAFTGATQSKPGQLEQASGGTLFLDEVGEMPPVSQAKFLRVLQEREFQRLGGTRVLKTNARIIAATNRDLQKAMARGQFREDLFYRLNVFAIHLPSLRERREDVIPLSKAFIEEIGRAFGRPPAGISREAQRALMEYDWPGNVRELRNVLERAAILCDGGLIVAEHLALRRDRTPPPTEVETIAESAPPPSAAAGDLKAVERRTIEQALARARFNKSQAAKLLGLSRAQLYSRLRRHGLE